MATAVRRFIEWNRDVSRWQRALLARFAPHFANDGPRHFREHVLPGLLKPGWRVLDVGGGKRPAIPLETKQELGLHVVGLDISQAELAQAPRGAYDEIIVGDVATVRIPGAYDLVLSRAVFEHLTDPRAAVANLTGALAPGGVMALGLPCRNAPFAILNRWLGNRLARRLLFALFPEKRESSGFRAYYRECTPSRMARLCRQHGLEVVQIIPYYKSDYSSFFAPLYTVDMLRQLLMSCLRAQDFSEAFSLVARASDAPQPGGRAWRQDLAAQPLPEATPPHPRQPAEVQAT